MKKRKEKKKKKKRKKKKKKGQTSLEEVEPLKGSKLLAESKMLGVSCLEGGSAAWWVGGGGE